MTGRRRSAVTSSLSLRRTCCPGRSSTPCSCTLRSRASSKSARPTQRWTRPDRLPPSPPGLPPPFPHRPGRRPWRSPCPPVRGPPGWHPADGDPPLPRRRGDPVAGVSARWPVPPLSTRERGTAGPAGGRHRRPRRGSGSTPREPDRDDRAAAVQCHRPAAARPLPAHRVRAGARQRGAPQRRAHWRTHPNGSPAPAAAPTPRCRRTGQRLLHRPRPRIRRTRSPRRTAARRPPSSDLIGCRHLDGVHARRGDDDADLMWLSPIAAGALRAS